MLSISFEWDPAKDLLNQKKHGVSFKEAQCAFLDKRRILAEDLKHSTAKETRYYCFQIWRWHSDGTLHLPGRRHPHLRCWVLGQG